MNLRQLREKRANVWQEMQNITAPADDEGRVLNAEETQRWEALDTELTGLTKQIEVEEKRASRASEANETRTAIDPSTFHAEISVEDVPADKRYAEAWRAWARGGMGNLDAEQRKLMVQRFDNSPELRAQGVGTTTAGGYFVPAEFRDQLIERQVFQGSVRSVATVITTDSGASLPWPTVDDTANVGAILAENTQVTEQDVTIGQSTLDVFMYTSKLVRVSLQLINDSAIDVDDLLGRLLAARIARIQNQHFTTGTGTAQPEGIQTNATSGVTLPTGNTTSITYDGLVDLVHSVDPAYRTANAKFMARDSVLASIRKLKDTTNQPLWQPSMQAGAPDTVLGYPIVTNPDMPAPAANVKSVLFGDFRQGYVIRDVTQVQALRLEERYADFLQVAFLLFQRSGGDVQDSNAYRALTQSAT
jgi:HK97 family phage major capsid protein